MSEARSLKSIKRDVQSNIGEKVTLKVNRGRRRNITHKGVIDEIYPSVFTVIVEDDLNNVQTLSYTYSDILISSIELILCKNNEKI
ncbi:MAG: Veg protein [Clostridiales bacterium]|nr:Veg protein [Clostridiales bacterium]